MPVCSSQEHRDRQALSLSLSSEETPVQLLPTQENSFSSKHRNYIILNAFQPPTAPSHHPSLGLMNTWAFMSHANNLVLVAVSLKSEHSQQPNRHITVTDTISGYESFQSESSTVDKVEQHCHQRPSHFCCHGEQ